VARHSAYAINANADHRVSVFPGRTSRCRHRRIPTCLSNKFRIA
jgi:hypothetical protein